MIHIRAFLHTMPRDALSILYNQKISNMSQMIELEQKWFMLRLDQNTNLCCDLMLRSDGYFCCWISGFSHRVFCHIFQILKFWEILYGQNGKYNNKNSHLIATCDHNIRSQHRFLIQFLLLFLWVKSKWIKLHRSGKNWGVPNQISYIPTTVQWFDKNWEVS